MNWQHAAVELNENDTILNKLHPASGPTGRGLGSTGVMGGGRG